MAASVDFIHPHDGAAVSSPVRMSFAVKGMEVKPAGDMTPDTGHFCLLLDRGPVPQGEMVPATGRAWHFSEGQTSVSLPLPPGRHRLTLQFDNGGHISYGPNMSKTIIVQVWALHGAVYNERPRRYRHKANASRETARLALQSYGQPEEQ